MKIGHTRLHSRHNRSRLDGDLLSLRDLPVRMDLRKPHQTIKWWAHRRLQSQLQSGDARGSVPGSA